MRPVTESFLNAIRGSHQPTFRARIVDPGQTGTDPDGTEIQIIGGDVVFDTKADVNSTLDMTTPLDWPATPQSLGAPYGQEVYVERGVKYGTGTTEWVGLGYFRIDSVEQVKAPKGLIRISGSDRMASVVDGRPIQPIQFTAGTSVGSILDFVIGEVVADLDTTYDWDAYSELIATDQFLIEDRMKFVRELVSAYGKIGYFDYAGRFQVRNVPDPNGSPVYSIDEGRSGVLVSMQRTISRDGVYNGVVASGEPVGDTAPVRGVALDLDPTSPTYWDAAGFGKVPRFFSSSFMTTDGQAANAAASLLIQGRGIPYVVQLGTVPNPALEGWDIVEVKFGPHDVEVHILDRTRIALDITGEMTCETRKQNLNA